MRICLVALCLATLSRAEIAFQYLAPNYDGSGVWFSSWLRMKGTDQYPHAKIFQWDEKNGVRLYDQKAPSISSLGSSSTAYNLYSVSASADSGTVAVTGARDCTAGTSCIFSFENYESEIRFSSRDAIQLGRSASLSSNGRFAYLTTSAVPLFMGRNDRLRDLVTGQEASLSGWSETFPYRHRVANDGTVVVTEIRTTGSELYLRSWPTGDLRPAPLAASTVMINDSATRLVYAKSGLVSYDIPTARETLLATLFASFDISNDGSVVAYLDSGQAWIVRADRSGKRRVTDPAETIAEMALSGDGNFLFAVTAASRILRVDLRNNALREIVPKVVLTRTVTRANVAIPGALYQFSTQSLPEIAEVRLLGQPQLILSQSGGNLLIQTRSDMAEGTDWAELVLREQTEGPFFSSMIWSPVRVLYYFPDWYHLPDSHIAALHEDFSGTVVSANPARPGEILHVFGSGFGRVSPEPEQGAPARANPLSRVIEPMLCELQGLSPGPVDILFAGLAPGFIGLYQFDVRLPTTLGTGDTYLACRRSGESASGASGLLPITSH